MNVYFKLIPEAEKDKTAISLKSQLSALRSSYDNRVDGSKSSYYVTLEVSDNGSPAKRYTKRVTVIVSRKFHLSQMYMHGALILSELFVKFHKE